MQKEKVLLDAKTAELITNEAIKAFNQRDHEAELADVLGTITANALARRKRVFFHQELLPRTVDELRRLGYDVREPQNEEWEAPRSYRITWNSEATTEN